MRLEGHLLPGSKTGGEHKILYPPKITRLSCCLVDMKTHFSFRPFSVSYTHVKPVLRFTVFETAIIFKKFASWVETSFDAPVNLFSVDDISNFRTSRTDLYLLLRLLLPSYYLSVSSVIWPSMISEFDLNVYVIFAHRTAKANSSKRKNLEFEHRIIHSGVCMDTSMHCFHAKVWDCLGEMLKFPQANYTLSCLQLRISCHLSNFV